MSEYDTVTIIDLLNLSLGTPEIGAVNFNLLHRFLLELLKHLSIGRKQIDITDDVAVQAALEETRMMSKSQTNFRGYSSFSETVESVRSTEIKPQESSTAREKADVEKCGVEKPKVAEGIESLKERVVEVVDGNESVQEKASLNEISGVDETEAATKVASEHDAKEETRRQSPDEKNTNNEVNKNPSSPSLQRSFVGKSRTPSPRRSASSGAAKRNKRASPTSSKTDIPRRSLVEINIQGIYQLERKISILEAKLEALSTAPSNLEIVQHARDLQSRDGSTTSVAGDMWQTMNIVRRIEVTEGAIDGITAMLDDISEQIKKMKENSFETQLNELSNEVNNIAERFEKHRNDIKPAEIKYVAESTRHDGDNHNLNEIQKKITELEEKLKDAACRSDLKSFVTAPNINNMIDLKLLTLAPVVPATVDPAPTSTPAKEETNDDNQRHQSTSSEIFQELLRKAQSLSVSREEMEEKIRELEERFSQTVDKDTFMSLQGEFSNLAERLNSFLKNQEQSEMKGALATATELNEVKVAMEEKIQALNKGVQEMKQNFFSFFEMKETVSNMKESGELLKCDVENMRKEMMKLIKQFNDEQESRNAIANAVGRKLSLNAGSNGEDFHEIRSSLLEMKNEVEKHGEAMKQIFEDQNKKQSLLDTLFNLVQHLDEIKADKQKIDREIEVKADRKDLEKKVSEDKFQNSLSSLDQSVQDLVEKLVGHEATLKQAINHITSDVNSKLDKVDLDPVKNYFEGKLKDLHLKVRQSPTEDKSSAAGTRCLLLHPANCISCDRPVNLYGDGTKLPSLPFSKPLPGAKSSRAHTTYELCDIRQKMFDGPTTRGNDYNESLGQAKVQYELLKLGAIKDSADLPELSSRPCGGNHTLTCAEKRSNIRVNKAYREDLHFIAQLSQKDLSIVDILGYDGHVYKGHVSQLPAIPEIASNTIGRRPTAESGNPCVGSPI